MKPPKPVAKREILEIGHGGLSVPRILWEGDLPKRVSYTGIDLASKKDFERKLDALGIPKTPDFKTQQRLLAGNKNVDLITRMRLEFPLRVLEHREEVGKLRREHGNPNIAFENVDAHKMPEEWTGRFHVVFANNFFNAPDRIDAKTVAGEIRRVMAPNGLLVTTNPYGEDLLDSREREIKAHGGFEKIDPAREKLPLEARRFIERMDKAMGGKCPVAVFRKTAAK